MTDFLIQAILSNLLVSTLLAAIAWSVQSRFHNASLSNLLWVLVLIKMITPPLFSIPLVEIGSIATSNYRSIAHQPNRDFSISDKLNRPSAGTTLLAVGKEIDQAEHQTVPFVARGCLLLITIWATVSAAVLVISSARIWHFHQMLRRHLRPMSPRLEKIARGLVAEMKLKRTPAVVESQANMSPFVWWLGGEPQVVIPRSATESLNDSDLRLIVAHELAHIKRGDHWVRWLEWLSVLTLWWNPVMWWACRQLRITEEIACDAMVLDSIHPKRDDYANSLLNMAELLATSAIRPPAVASAMNSGGNMEKRLTMIIAEKSRKISKWQRALMVAVAVGVFPLGLVYAQDFEAVEKRLGGAVEAGELTLEQAAAMMAVLKRSANEPQGSEKRELEARKRRYMEFAREIEAAVEAGKLSKEEAEEKLIAMRREMFEEASDEDRGKAMEARKRRYMEFAREIEAAVEAGKLSEEEAEEKLIAVRRDLFEEASDDDRGEAMEARKRRYMEFAREIEAAVEAGKLSEEEAEEKLIAMRRDLFEEASDDDRGEAMEARKRRYMEFAREIEAAVEAGKLSEEEAEEKLIAVRRDLFEEASDDDRGEELEARKRRFMEFARDIEAAVDAGKLSKEDAEKKLVEMRRTMFEAKPEGKRESGDIESRKRRYEQLAKRIKAAIEEGDLSAEDGEKKLVELRKEIFGGGD